MTLRALAGSGTVIWLRTRSNMLRDSTVEALALFPEAYVQLRPPVKEEQVRQLRRAPRVGAWLDAQALDGAGAALARAATDGGGDPQERSMRSSPGG